ncbi:MAG: PorT family protein [Prevotella sp.]|nr:PorT family protein [Prevotella sp.]
MKKIILSAVVMLASVASYAQHAVGTVSLKPEVGLSIANTTKTNTDYKVGLSAGAELEYQAGEIFSVSAGAIYNMQGNKLGSYKTNLGYINVPILANVYVVPGLAVKLGVQPGFCVSKDNTPAKTVDVAIPVGLSYEYNNFVLDGRYNFGVTKAFDASDAKNSVFQVTLGYKFDL